MLGNLGNQALLLGLLPFGLPQLETRLAIKMGAVKRFNQPLASQPGSPSKSSARSFASSVFGAPGGGVREAH